MLSLNKLQVHVVVEYVMSRIAVLGHMVWDIDSYNPPQPCHDRDHSRLLNTFGLDPSDDSVQPPAQR